MWERYSDRSFYIYKTGFWDERLPGPESFCHNKAEIAGIYFLPGMWYHAVIIGNKACVVNTCEIAIGIIAGSKFRIGVDTKSRAAVFIAGIAVFQLSCTNTCACH